MAKKKILLSMSEELVSRLDDFCSAAGVSRAAYVSILLMENLPPSPAAVEPAGFDAADMADDADFGMGGWMEWEDGDGYAG